MEHQKSPNLLRSLRNIEINGNTQSIALFKTALDATLSLGDLEHTGDWDPFLKLQCRKLKGITALNGSNDDLEEILNGGNIESATGYPELEFGDFNDEDNKPPHYLNNHQEITNIIIQCKHPQDEEDTIGLVIPIECITLISVER